MKPDTYKTSSESVKVPCMSGTLYLIATPIGNLQDFSRRGIETIEACDFLLVEDTRVTVKLLNHFNIKKRMVSCHEHNEKQRLDLLKEASEANQSVGLISDAGMPLISDPGDHIVQQALEAGMNIIPIPGPSAFLLGLVASGFALDRFVFEGFLPEKSSDVREKLQSLVTEERTIVFYVSPHKLLKTLAAVMQIMGNRKACLARELTKLHEEFVRLPVSEMLTKYETAEVRGEFVLIIEGFVPTAKEAPSTDTLKSLIKNALDSGQSVKDISTKLSQELGLRRADIYKMALSVDNEATD